MRPTGVQLPLNMANHSNESAISPNFPGVSFQGGISFRSLPFISGLSSNIHAAARFMRTAAPLCMALHHRFTGWYVWEAAWPSARLTFTAVVKRGNLLISHLPIKRIDGNHKAPCSFNGHSYCVFIKGC